MSGPIPSPQVPAPLGDEPGTDPNALVTNADLKSANAFTRYLGIALAFLFSGGAGSCGVVSALSLVRTEARAQAREVTNELDAGAKAHEARIATLEQQRTQDRQEAHERFLKIEESSRRQETKLDALLDRFRIPNPAPAPTDGGPR